MNTMSATHLSVLCGFSFFLIFSLALICDSPFLIGSRHCFFAEALLASGLRSS